MSEYDDVDDDLEADEAESSKKNPLRPVVKAKDKELAELRSELNTLRAAQATATVADLLKAAGADTKYAKFYSGDASKDAVTSWIDENADLFGISKEDDTDPDVVEAAGAIQRAASGAPQTKIGSNADLITRIQKSGTREEFLDALKAAGFSTT